ncbi:MAG: aminoacyltransferase, partial [Streptococcaceae bacterium]|nr:aminoacyltransferase [Streptococcaceae bacterium]
MMEFVELTAEEFGAFVCAQEKIHFQQTVEMGELQKRLGHQPLYFGIKAADNLIGAMLVILTKVKFGYLASAHGNPYFSESLDANRFFIKALAKKLRQMSAIKLVIHSNENIACFDDRWENVGSCEDVVTGFYQAIGLTPAVLSDFEQGFQYNYEKDLTDFASYEEVSRSFKKKAKQSIKKARDFGIEIVELPYERLAEFKAVVDEAGDRRQFATRSLSYYQSAYLAYQDKIKFLAAELNFSKYLTQVTSEYQAKLAEVNQLEAELSVKSSEKKQNRLEDIKTYQLASLKKRQAEVAVLVETFG